MTVPLPPLICVRCGHVGHADDPDRFLGCPRCRADGAVGSYRCRATDDEVRAAVRGDSGLPGIWRHAPALPAREPVSLGEGATPLVPMERLGDRWGLPQLWAKNESANPTWSHKDRLAAATVAAARASGSSVVAAASTGNHGAAVAAYAARAGLACVIATLPSVPPTMQALMASFGACVVATRTSVERYDLLCAGVRERGWYAASNLAAPAVGSDPYGVAGYKTIAYELVADLGDVPEWVVVPVAYGDCLAGLADGFHELRSAGITHRVPRLVGAELFGALGGALAGQGTGPVAVHPTLAFSIAGAYTTPQAVAALAGCDGLAVSVREQDLAAARRDLARHEGLLAEAAAAVPFAAARCLVGAGVVGDGERVVCLLTSTGLKDHAIDPDGRAVPVVPPRLSELDPLLPPEARA